MVNYKVCALYKFVRLQNIKKLKLNLYNFLIKNDIYGTILLAEEGINGTISGKNDSIEKLLNYIQSEKRFGKVDYKISHHSENPFYRTKVKIKKEIVTLGIENVSPIKDSGIYVDPKNWNSLIMDKNTILIDTRNDYEIKIGTFKNSINPHTETFREIPTFLDLNLKRFKNKNIAMFCTGGIRCEKSTSYLKQKGFKNVYHLKGGILNYLKNIPKKESLWKGECFVFDNRVSVNHSLEKGLHDQCFACRMPINSDHKKHPDYKEGISCPFCNTMTSEKQKNRYKERQKQINIAKKKGMKHIGNKK